MPIPSPDRFHVEVSTVLPATRFLFGDRLLGRHAGPFERRDALPGGGLQLFTQRLRVVGDQFDVVARSAAPRVNPM